MSKFIPLAYKSKRFPHSPTMALHIDTDVWKIGFAHYEEPMSMSINTEIQFLCFALRWRKFIEDIQMEKGTRMKDLLEAYENNKNFHDYVDKSMEQYGKSLEETLENKTVQEYLKSIEKGGINCKESEV